MRKIFFITLVSLVLSGCQEEKVLKVGTIPGPHAEILKHITPQLEEKGIRLQVEQFDDYYAPNQAVEKETLAANFFQHTPWMEMVNEERNWHLTAIAQVYVDGLGAYSSQWKTKEEIPQGATVAFSNATIEITRALLLLDEEEVIQLNDRKGDKGIKDIEKNPNDLQFRAVEKEELIELVDQVDVTLLSTNIAWKNKKNLQKKPLFIEEEKNSPYINVLVVKKGNENIEELKILANILQSKGVDDFIQKKYK